MFGGRSSSSWVRHSVRLFKFQHATSTRPFCNSTASNNKLKHPPSDSDGSSSINYLRDLDNLNFTKAAKILFSTPHKKKNFGLDFHLVQLFFALMPSLAVYLVAQYARYDMRKMEAELELKKKAEEEQKAKEMEAAAAEEKEAESTSPELLKVKERLEALEETLKEIVVETKKRPSEEKSKNADQYQERVGPKNRSDDSHTPDKKKTTTQEAASQEPQKQCDSEKKGSQEDDKK
ncbi:uncharacterized protein LOC110690160 [Chenopodium quinoa]|nr:uncharacterized protein LOC110690160 [Chenopodium quinoa]XP_021722689.1 uncharacterized protein LOC110690160 [Chenopodium quinoa]XP_021722696.1 uncharacterized protein LOC110690160 [Chenopodium quinoa]XP_021722701.1 uncharacterized protein LOC110690160 [Chenopodium quinoa]XP_021722707.1 uncharacterized protein LOC110690160 [Chenopodium quinoa]XP_021722712.1 uncharacterized protein LOC110690160 [Chenopodium quinoa]XP_021722719.1 uncharacterized protein LOC110690160 [Chenopodium quinoa]